MAAEPMLWTIPQAAEALAVSVRTIYRLTAAGDLPIIRVGRCIRLRPEDVRAYVSSRAGQAQEETPCQSAQPEIKTASTGGRTPRPGGAATPSEAERLAARLGF